MKPLARRALLILVGLGLVCPGTAATPYRFTTDEPVWTVQDTKPIPEPGGRGENRYHNFIDGYWLRPLNDALGLRRQVDAQDLNSMEEVPGSSWFTPRLGNHPMTPEVVGRGPLVAGVLRASAALPVVAARVDGSEPFVVIEETTGRQCVLVFDDPRYPEMRTAATVIANRVLYAAGYHVLESFITEVDPATLAVADDARKIGEFGGDSDLGEGDLAKLLERLESGETALRVAACRLPGGTPKGGFAAKGRRGDDPNDQIPHENRRSLRGLRVLCSWIDLTRMRSDRTLDVYLSEGEYLRHHLVGLGLSLGARLQAPHPFGTEGRESYWEMGRWFTNIFKLGFGPSYQDRPAEQRFAGVGSFEARGFDPPAWKPAYRFEPFANTGWADAFWAAKIVASFTDEHLSAAVSAGHISDPAARAYLTGTLVERRDRIAAAYLGGSTAADRFEIRNPNPGRWMLAFEDLSVLAGVVHPDDVQYSMVFRLPDFGGKLGQQSRGGHYRHFDLTAFVPPEHLHRHDPQRYAVAEVRAFSHLGKWLPGRTDVHIYFDPRLGPRIIGLYRY